MISVLDIGQGVLGISVSSKVEKPDIERAIAAWDATVAAYPKFSVYVEINSLSGITPQALLRDLQLGITRMTDLSHVDKFAVVTDIGAIKTLVNFEGKLGMHWFDTQVFALSQKTEALSWVKAPRDIA